MQSEDSEDIERLNHNEKDYNYKRMFRIFLMHHNISAVYRMLLFNINHLLKEACSFIVPPL